MKHLRIFGNVCLETWMGLSKSGWSNWLVISILAIALTIFGGVLQITMSLKSVVNAWGSQLQISAYLKDGCEPKDIAAQISKMKEVKLVEIVPKEVAWQEMQSALRVAAIDNPLPNTLHVHVTNPELVEGAAQNLRKLNGVEHIRYPLKVARNINSFRHILEAVGVAVTAALTAATLMVIGNTIQLIIQARHREIEIMSLTGVSPWYIKGPFVLQGAAYGLVSAILAISLIGGFRLYMDAYVTGQLASIFPVLLSVDHSYGMFSTFFVLMLLGMAVGAGGSFWVSGKYIKV